MPSSYQKLDIKALQYLYGKSRTDAETGAQTYDFGPTANDNNQFMETISNTNAASVIDASDEVLKNVIDLRAGHSSSIGIRSPYAGLPACYGDAKTYARNVPGGPKPTYDGRNNLTFASDSHIDQAMAGQAGDTIIGNNDATNAIVGGGGNDAIFLGEANTTVRAGQGFLLCRVLRSRTTSSAETVHDHADENCNATALPSCVRAPLPRHDGWHDGCTVVLVDSAVTDARSSANPSPDHRSCASSRTALADDDRGGGPGASYSRQDPRS